MIAPPPVENNPVLNNHVIEEIPVLQNSVSTLATNSIPENIETELPKGMEEERKENIDLLKTEMNDKVFQIEINKIKPNPYQPRREFDQKSIEELAASINEYGILEPLIVTRHEIETPNGVDVEYQLIAGERRFRASKYLGLKTVPAIVKKVESDVLKLELALVENVQREDLSSITKAKSYAKLISEFGYTQEMVGLRVGKSRESIANTLRLLQLPFEAQRAIEEGRITESHARALLLLPNMEKQRALLGEILTKQLSSREAELIARQFLEKHGNGKPIVRKRLGDSFDPLDLELREKLEEVFGTKVLIKRKGETGEISIHFDSKDELEGLLNKMSKLSEKRVSSTADKLAS
jgi:ParB family chromosome partitioning protein